MSLCMAESRLPVRLGAAGQDRTHQDTGPAQPPRKPGSPAGKGQLKPAMEMADADRAGCGKRAILPVAAPVPAVTETGHGITGKCSVGGAMERRPEAGRTAP